MKRNKWFKFTCAAALLASSAYAVAEGCGEQALTTVAMLILNKVLPKRMRAIGYLLLQFVRPCLVKRAFRGSAFTGRN